MSSYVAHTGLEFAFPLLPQPPSQVLDLQVAAHTRSVLCQAHVKCSLGASPKRRPSFCSAPLCVSPLLTLTVRWPLSYTYRLLFQGVTHSLRMCTVTVRAFVVSRDSLSNHSDPQNDLL